MPVPHGLRALDPRDFRRFYGAQLLALVGGWMQAVAQAWLVLQLTDSPFRLGLISTLQFSPILVFSVVTGAMADRLPKRALLVATQTTLACQAFLLGALVATGRVEYWHVAALGLALGFANVFDQPARQSFVMEMVGKGDVANAVALNSAAFNAARIVGPAVAGVLIAPGGVGPAFFVNGAGFVGVILPLRPLEARRRPPRAGRGARRPRAEPPRLDGDARPGRHRVLRHRADGELQHVDAARSARRASRSRDEPLYVGDGRRLPDRRLPRRLDLAGVGRVGRVPVERDARASGARGDHALVASARAGAARGLAAPRSDRRSSAGFAGATIPGGRFRKGGETPLRGSSRASRTPWPGAPR